VGIEKDMPYTRGQILDAFSKAYRSNLFSLIYPVIQRNGDTHVLVIKVQEHKQAKLGVSIRYNDVDELVVGASVIETNFPLRNSRWITRLEVGGKPEFDVDFIKTFGNRWGVYYHLFPYVKEERRYYYNDAHEKTRSSWVLESGGTAGVGAFASDLAALELFSFSFHNRYYRDVSTEEIDTTPFQVSGFGAKLYHESLNDFSFPMSGTQLMMKLNVAREGWLSDEGYKRFYGRFLHCQPLASQASLVLRTEYSTYFESKVSKYDITPIGGIDSFMGFHRNEYNAPFFRISELTLRIQATSHIFADLVMNMASFGNSDQWNANQNEEWAGGIRLGYSTYLGPIKAGVGFQPHREAVGYISVGYNIDAFEFSRR
jgi:outer membrane translocation and assembly module TamA